MKKAKKIISSLITIILSITLLFMIFVVISSKASGGEPNFLGYQLKTVLSGSMEPTFKTGSIIAVKPVEDKTSLKKGDVITFMITDDQMATHRVIDVIKNVNHVMYKTKGDNNDNADTDPVVAQNVVAKYTGFTIPYVGYLVDYAKSKNGTALLLILPGLLLLAYSGFTIFKALREIDNSKKSKDVQETV
ncbi:signal peptidase I [Neobacillus bataviensis LMG 21833]|uniref:Signal peptidase I n=1 Tax=Neobacillus bataviensis LMG 21833 TaxID=1117379 RepID=K6CEG2_9BACI|nr:signal peptidase I [Neobacillus bataviensis]EKN69495.1 signal peptidase I [Neobacillus bataviensis LMG 21833]